MSEVLWSPSEEFKKGSNLFAFEQWLSREKSSNVNLYDSTWDWSVNEIESFWKHIVRYFDIQLQGQYSKVLTGNKMPHYKCYIELFD